jgi:hypothetical protein
MESREQRIATLAATLRSSGIARSDGQAKMMAEDMIGVEEHVQRDYEVEHTRAHDYLQTAKNLGNPRQTIKPEQKTAPVVEQQSSRKIEPLSNVNPKVSQEHIQEHKEHTEHNVSQEYTDVNFGGKTLNQVQADHDTHNSALEAIKAQLSRTRIIPLEDMNPEDVEVQETFLEPKIEPITAAKLSEIKLSGHALEEVSKTSDVQKISDVSDISDTPKTSLGNVVPESVSQSIPEVISEEPKLEESKLEESKSEEPKLNAQKLIDMMEEDGKLEEHTREIKEKPKDVKPKEAYEENNIDLGSMFDFNKGTTRK